MKRMLIWAAAALTSLSVCAARPKLVVSIVVDQLRTDYVEFLRTRMGKGGFNRLMTQGVYMRDVDFGVVPHDAASATAMLYTGAFPATTGVPEAYIYSDEGRTMRAALNDPSKMGNYTTETFSPAPLRLSTVSDEIAIDGAGLGAVHAVALDPQQAIIMAGHAGNSATWINENSGKWATTTYYPETPAPIGARNGGRSAALHLDTVQWKPLHALDTYEGIPAQKRYYPFRHTFSSGDKDVYRQFISSPMGNREAVDMAIEYLQTLQLGGRGDAIDMLNVGLTAAPFKYVKDGDYRLELQDTYLRLDADLARLFAAIDKAVGAGNALIFLSSTGYYDDATPDDEKFRIPTGDFSMKRAISLLNAYLAAKHGNGDYVGTLSGRHLYLDHKTIESRGLDAAEVADEARVFLCKMAGVADAYTIKEILGQKSPDLERLRLAIDPKNSGDVLIEFMPGWNVVDDLHFPVVKTPVRTTATTSPAFLCGAGLQPRVVEDRVEAVELAPTIARTLRLRLPNGAVRRGLLF